MTKLSELINPPPILKKIFDPTGSNYRFLNTTYELFNGLLSTQNPALSTNSDLNTLGSNGLTPITQADGDNVEFIGSWDVVGSTQATYTLTPTTYANNSNVVTISNHYVHVVVTTYSGTGLYFYQRQALAARKYQDSDLTLSLQANNNQNKTIKLRLDVVTQYAIGNQSIKQGNAFYLRPGMNNLSATVTTDRIGSTSVTSDNYVEFRLVFDDLVDGIADFNLYALKVERGKISTPLN